MQIDYLVYIYCGRLWMEMLLPAPLILFAMSSWPLSNYFRNVSRANWDINTVVSLQIEWLQGPILTNFNPKMDK